MDSSLLEVYDPVSENQPGFLFFGSGAVQIGPAYDGRKPEGQLLGKKGLCQIVVCAEAKSEKAVVVLISGGKEQDRDVCICTKFLKQRKAVSVRKHDVQNDEIRGFG